jgi:hypothetical protein
MSKNLTRKGLALGALFGLTSTAIAGTPAFAADEVVFALSSGTVYAAPVDDTLTLNASLASSVPAANIAQLKFRIVTDGTFTAKAVITSGSTTAQPAKFTNAAAGTTTTGVGTGTMAAAVASTVLVPATAPSPTFANTIAVSVDAVPDSTTPANGVAPSATTATRTVAVTAFLDSNNNGTVDAGEFQATQTLSFKKYSEITADYTLTAPSAGATSVAGKATFTNINQNQLTKTVTGVFSVNAVARTAVATTVASGVYSSTDTYTVVAADVIGFSALLAGAALGSTETTATATARTIDSIGTPALVAGDNATAAGKFRNAGVFTARTTVTKGTPAVAVAGIAGTATFATSATLSDTVYVTVNGTDYKTNALLTAASIALTSDASGYLAVEIKTTGFVAQTVTTTFTAQNYTGNVVATAEAAVYYAVDVADVANINSRLLLSAATTTVAYQVMDQYGVAPANDKFRAVLTGAAAAYQPVVDGKASFTVTGGTGASQAYTIALEDYVTASASFNTAYTEGTANDDGFTVTKPAAANVSVAGAVALTTAVAADGNFFAHSQAGALGGATATTKLSISDKAFSSVDTRLDKKTAAPTLAAGYTTGSTATVPVAGTAAGNAAVSITVVPKGSDVAATAIAAPVTVSGTGLLFQVGTTTFKTDSITLLAAAAGTVVKVYSQKAGAQVVTVTSGTASKTVTLNYATIAAEAANVAYSSLPAQAQSGRALDLAAVVTDKWGNTVAGASVAFNNTGVGYVQNTAAVTSDATGKVAGRLIVLQNDLGTSFLSATLDLATDVVVAKSIEFGLADVDVVAGGKRIFVNAEFAMGRTVTISINGKRVYSKVQTTDNAVELAFTQRKAGNYTVTVRMSGGIVATERLSIR